MTPAGGDPARLDLHADIAKHTVAMVQERSQDRQSRKESVG
jgi:hypothetical protein